MSDHATLTAREFQDAGGTEDFRVLGCGAAAWYAAPGHLRGAHLVARLAETGTESDTNAPPLDLDVRATGVRVRLPLTPLDAGFTRAHVDLARTVAGAAADLGLTPDPSVLQDVQLAFDVLDQGAVQPFWSRVLRHESAGDEDLIDPGRRLPPIWFQDQDAPRPLRNRLHLDVVTPVEQARSALADVASLGASSVLDHGYYATVADAEGNEVDLLPLVDDADRWPDRDSQDWRLVFAAIATYPVPSSQVAAELATAAAVLADEAGLPLDIDVRPGQVTLATAKDGWEIESGYAPLAARLQSVARDLGLAADTDAPRFTQVVIDAVDIPAVRRFWQVVLGYALDPRDGVTDLVDPHDLNFPLVLQNLDAGDLERRSQRNRIHLDVFLPDDLLPARLEAALAAGGTVVRDAGPIGWTVSDPEGNEVDLTTSAGREEHWHTAQSTTTD